MGKNGKRGKMDHLRDRCLLINVKGHSGKRAADRTFQKCHEGR